MRKSDCIESVAERLGIVVTDVQTIVDEFLAVISETLEQGEPVKLHGFGRFESTEVEKRAWRTPKATTQNKIFFVPGNLLKKRVNRNEHAGRTTTD